MWNRNEESLVSSMTGRLPPSAIRSTHGIGQAGAEVTEVLVPDDVVRLGLRIGPLKMTVAPPSRTMMPSSGKALVASTTKRAVWIGDPATGRGVGQFGELVGILFDPACKIGDGESSG